jgi:hypothetical protein
MEGLPLSVAYDSAFHNSRTPPCDCPARPRRRPEGRSDGAISRHVSEVGSWPTNRGLSMRGSRINERPEHDELEPSRPLQVSLWRISIRRHVSVEGLYAARSF